jgi:excisionase family DNA binding protein
LITNFVTAKELSRYLKLSEATIYKLALTGQLPGFKIGDSWRFDMEEILKLIKGNSREKKW